ncbi:MAG: hypothetical protein ACYS9X_18625 [Planctomycetota bacterium]|jgi:hypothetical protein
MRTLAFLLAVAALHAASCRRQSAEADMPAPTARPKHAEEDRDTVRIEIGPRGTSFRFSARQSGGTVSDAARMDRLIGEHDLLQLDVEPKSDPTMVRRFMEAYLKKPGFWKRITLSPRDPDERWEGYEARLDMDKRESAEGEPIPVMMGVTTTDKWGSPWWLLTPDRLRVRDSDGRDVNLFRRQVTGFDGLIRSKVFATTKERTIDLTSFVEPYHGMELVNRFAPGTYSVTFHFSYAWPHQDDVIGPEDFVHPCVWGPMKSNTVTFTVRPAEDARPVDVDSLFREAERSVAASDADGAVRAYKQVVLSTDDQKVLEKAIAQVLLIRAIEKHDERDLFPDEADEEAALVLIDPAARKERAKPLRRRMDEFPSEWDRSRASIRREAFRLSLLHVSRAEAERWYREFIRCRAGEFDWETPEEKEIQSRWDGVGDEFFNYSPFRDFLLRDVAKPDTCPKPCVEIYLRLQGKKDAALLRELLRAHTDVVLHHFCEDPAPRELLGDIARYFDDRTRTWGNGPIQAERRDDAMLAFERAAGLDLGFGLPHQSFVPERIPRREAIRAILENWRRRRSEAAKRER